MNIPQWPYQSSRREFLIVSFNPSILAEYDTHYRPLWRPVKVSRCSKSYLDTGLHFVRIEEKKMPLTSDTRPQISGLVKTRVCIFRKNVQIPSDKFTLKTHFLPQSKQTCLLQMTTHFVLDKSNHCVLPVIIRNKHTMVGTMQHLLFYAVGAHTSNYICALFRFQQVFCLNFFILLGYRCLTQPCKTKHLPQPDDSISVERENRVRYRNVLDNGLTNALR
jgi:hypothetical protein